MPMYPCNYCSSCPVWLAAFYDEYIDSYDKLAAECERQECPLVHKEAKI